VGTPEALETSIALANATAEEVLHSYVAMSWCDRCFG
jgi:hypothetical protein